MPHIQEEISQSLRFDEPVDFIPVLKESSLKRKRGFYPYTDDDDGHTSSGNEQSLCPPILALHVFEDSIPWYQWRRKSFATPQERVKTFTVPDSDSESEDEFWDALEPESENQLTKFATTQNENDSCEPPISGIDRCCHCTGIKNATIVEEAKTFKSYRRVSKLEATIHSGVNHILTWTDRLTHECSNIKRVFDQLRRKTSERTSEPSMKRVKYDPSIAIIPKDAQWPPSSMVPTKSVTKSQNVIESQNVAESYECSPPKSKKVKIPRNVKQYINAQYDEFIAKQKSFGFCVCQCQRPFPKLLPRSLEFRFPGTYPQSEEESDEETPTSLAKHPGSVARGSLNRTPKRPSVALEDGITKGPQSRRMKGKVKGPAGQGRRENKKKIKRSYMRPSRADVYYL